MNFVWGFAEDAIVTDAFKIRVKVFVQEQGFSVDGELDVIDKISHHIVGYDDAGEPKCTARIFTKHKGIYHIGRIAVSEELRGKGIGRILLDEIILKIKGLNGETILLDAQYDKVEFYEKCGFVRTGEDKLEEGYPHIGMKMSLK